MLLDTSGLLGYLHQSEPHHHHQAVQLLNSVSERSLAHSYVLSELIALALIRRFPRPAVLAFVMDLLDTPDIETVWVNEQLHREAMQLLLDRPDKTYLSKPIHCVMQSVLC